MKQQPLLLQGGLSSLKSHLMQNQKIPDLLSVQRQEPSLLTLTLKKLHNTPAVGGFQIEEVQPKSAPLSSFHCASRDIGSSSSRATIVSSQSSASQHETPQQSRWKESVVLLGQSAESGANLSGPSQSKIKPSGSSNSGANTTCPPKSTKNFVAGPPQSAASTASH